MEVTVSVISQELIKPSSSTPEHFRHYSLSFLDQIAVPVFMPLVLFYAKDANITNLERCNLAKESLSEALTYYYPLAGRVRDNMYIDCNDEGVHFVEAQANCTLSDILRDPNPSDMNKFLPFELDDVKDLAAVFQVTFLECGGLAVGSGLSHKAGDALSYFMFLNSWAAIARGRGCDLSLPRFESAQLFPPKNISGYQPRTGIVKDNIVTKRFVFDASTIASIREKYSNKGSCGGEHPKRPTRVEALSAFIWSRFMASTKAKADHAGDEDNKLYTVLHAVNLRPRMDPPLSNHYFGNISRIAIAEANTETDDGSTGFLSQMRDAIKNVNLEYVKKNLQQGDGHLNFLKERAAQYNRGEVVSLSFTSLCRLPVYEADFGWGKPVWAGSARMTFKNLVVFFDTKEGDGIEAWLNLKEEDMVKLEGDKELLAHISPAPNVKISVSS